MQLESNSTDAVVIGGGLAGLTAAALLAHQGKQVMLFEQSSSVGGRARTKQQDGFHFNLGPHALYRSGPGIDVLKQLGITPKGGQPKPSGGYAIYAGAKHTFPAGLRSLLTTSLFGLAAKLETARLLSSISKVNASALMSLTQQEWVDQNIMHGEVRSLIHAVFRLSTYVNAPELMSAGVAISQLQKALAKSVLYLDGGWQTLVDDLRRVAEQYSVRIETETTIESIDVGAGGVTGVRRVDGVFISAPDVIIAASPKVAACLVPDPYRSHFAAWAERAVPVRASSLEIALDHLPKPKAVFALSIDRPLYLSVHSAAARLAPEGGALIQLAKYVPPDDEQSAESIERELEVLMDLVQPGWRDRVVYRRFLPDLVVMNAMPTARDGGYSGRPAPETADAAGLYVVGDWVGDEGLLADASLASARRAAEMIGTAKQNRFAAAI